MTKEGLFITLVQTAAIIESITKKDWQENNPSRSMMAAIVVSIASKIPEREIPDDVAEACDQFINYMYNDSIPKPTWLIGYI